MFGRRKSPPISPAEDVSSLGQILLKQGAVTQDQLDEATHDQTNGSKGRPLGELLLEMGAINQCQLDVALIEQKRLRGKKIDYAEESVRMFNSLTKQSQRIAPSLDELKSIVADFKSRKA